MYLCVPLPNVTILSVFENDSHKMSMYQGGKKQKPPYNVQLIRHPPSLHVSDFVSI